MKRTTKQTPANVKIGVRPNTRAKFLRFSETSRLKLVDVADIAIDALTTISREQLTALIERSDKRQHAA